MSSVFGNGSDVNDTSPYDYDGGQDIRLANLEALIATPVNLAPLTARVQVLETDNTTNKSNITTNTTNIIANTSSILVQAGQITSINSQITSINSQITSINSANITRDIDILGLQVGKVDNSVYNAYVTSNNAAVSLCLERDVYNTFITSQTTLDNTQNSRILALENLPAFNPTGYVTQTSYDLDKLEQAVINNSNSSSILFLTSNKADLSTLNSFINTQTTTNATLASSIVTANTNVTNVSNRVTTLEARTFPQTAFNTPATVFAGVLNSAPNVQSIMQTLQNNINSISISGSGFNASVTKFINNMNNSYLGQPLVTSLNGDNANNEQVARWYFIYKMNQELGVDAKPNFSGLFIRLGSILPPLNKNFFRILGSEDQARWVINPLFEVDYLGVVRSWRWDVGQNQIQNFEMSRAGVKFDTGAQIGIIGQTQLNIQTIVDTVTTLNATQTNDTVSSLSKLTGNRFRDLIIGFDGTGLTPGFEILRIWSQITNRTRISMNNLGDIMNFDENGNMAHQITAANGYIMNGYGRGAANDVVMLQINAPANAEARVQLFNNGSITSYGSTRVSGGFPSFTVDTIGDIECHSIYAPFGVDTNVLTVNGNQIRSFLKNNNEILIETPETQNSSGTSKQGDIKIITGASNFIAQPSNGTSSIYLGSDFQVDFATDSTFIGHRNEALLNNVGTPIIIIGNTNRTIDNGSALQIGNTTMIGFGNNAPYQGFYDNSRRIVVGSNNTCNNDTAILGNDNNLDGGTDAFNGPGNVQGTCGVFGHGWNTTTATGTNDILQPNTYCLGSGYLNANGQGVNRFVLGSGNNAIPVADGFSEQLYYNISYGFDVPKNCIVKNPSSIKYKENVVDYTVNIDDFMKIRAVDFNYKGKSHLNVGCIAEEMYEIPSFKRFVIMSENEIESISYNNLIAPIINIIQQQQKQINELKEKLNNI